MELSNKNEKLSKLSTLEFDEIKLDGLEIMEEAILPAGLLCGFGCIGGGVWCGTGCPH